MANDNKPKPRAAPAKPDVSGNYRVLEPITFTDHEGNRAHAKPAPAGMPPEIVWLPSEDAESLLRMKAVELATELAEPPPGEPLKPAEPPKPTK